MLELRNLTVHAGNFSVNQCCIYVQQGACHVLLGPTGSGKTIILESVAGLRCPESGAVYLDGCKLTHLPPEKRGIAYVPQDLALFPYMSVRENIAYSLKIRGLTRHEREEKVIPVAGLLGICHTLDRSIFGLSGGERQRVALARALISKSRLLLLDEPLSALDLSLRRELWYVLKEIQQTHHLTLLLVTHDLDEALFLGDTVSVIADGAILQTGEKNAVYRSPRTVASAKIMGVENFFQVAPKEAAGEGTVLFCPELNLTFNVRGKVSAALPFGKGLYTMGVRASAIKLIPQNSFSKSSEGSFTIDAICEKGWTTVAVLRSRYNKNARIVVEEPIQKGRPAVVGQGVDIVLLEDPLIF